MVNGKESQSDTGQPMDEGPLPPKTRLGSNYRIERVLGYGSMGIVYLAHDQALERKVAVKILAPHYAADQRVARRFRREAVAMASVRHEHVVQIFAFGDHQDRPYFVMEYIPGHPVATLIENANRRTEYLYLDVVIGILSQVCRGLSAVHQAGIVHRDLKPQNMLVGPNFRVALADFGLVEILEKTARRDLSGTPLYLAPELIRREELPDERRHLSDIYALGVSTYEMLTGDVPFVGKTIKEILRRHIKDPPTPVSEIRSDLPTAIDDVIARAMAKSPDDRYPDCDSFIEALGEARNSASEVRHADTSRILVAEADPRTNEIYRTALKVGFPQSVIMTADDGLTALEMTKVSRPDLLFVDLDLQGMNGLELCATLRGDELTSKVPLVVVAFGFDGDARGLLRSLGITDLLVKPVEATDLVNVARRHLDP